MERNVVFRACAALGWMVLLAGCDLDSQIASDGMADAAVAPDSPADAPADSPADAITLLCDFDLDGDGESDDRCPGGTDCDDRDALVGRRSEERCTNSGDDDCDGLVDEAACTTPLGGGCDAPTVVTASGTVEATMFPVTDASRARCSLGIRSGYGDVIGRHLIRIDLPGPRSVRLRAQWGYADSGVALVQVTDCGSELVRCGSSSLSEVVGVAGITSLGFAALPAGSHFFEVWGAGVSSVHFVEVQIDPVSPPVNDVCAAAITVPGDYGVHAFTAELAGAAPGAEECGPRPPDGSDESARSDVYYRLDLPSAANLTVEIAARVPGEYVAFVRSGGCDAGTSVRCAGTAEDVLLRSLAPGSYVIVVSGPNAGRAAVTLTLEPPTATLPGETCDDPVRLESGTTRSDTFEGRDLDIPETACGFPEFGGLPLRDIVYDFVLTEPSDVEVRVESPLLVEGRMRPSVASIESECGGLWTLPQRCLEYVDSPSSSVWRTRVRGLTPGRYFVIVSGERGGDVAVSFDATPAVTPTEVAGNVDCASSYAVDGRPGRHTYVGTLAPGEEAVFHVELAAASRLGAYAHYEWATATETRSVNTTLRFQSLCSETSPRPIWGAVLALEAGRYSFFVRYPDGLEGPIPYEIRFEVGGGT
jgi:hypothetical protein